MLDATTRIYDNDMQVLFPKIKPKRPKAVGSGYSSFMEF